MSAGTLLNTSIGAYRLADFLGAGGMGEVYRAVHVGLGRVVALKVLTRVGTDAVSLERFRNEARVHARLQHPNIATLFDFLEQGGQPCIVMEYVDGETLDRLIRRAGALPPREGLRVFAAIADAVAYLHANGIIHRDIKSNNVKISSTGGVKLLDFGIAKASFSPTLTATGSVIGTMHYLAPEQIASGTAGPRSDVWALGVLLYEITTGQLPFDGPDSFTDRILRAAYAPASQVCPAVPRELDRIIGRCLRRRPAERYASAGELLADVRALLASSAPAAPPSGPARLKGLDAPVRVDVSGVNWRLAAGVGAALATLLFFFWAVTRPEATRAPAAPVDSVASEPAPAVTEPVAPRLQTVHITVRGGSALVYREGRFINGTPFDLTEAVGERVQLTLERAGHRPLQVEFTVTEGKTEYEFELTPLPAPAIPQDPPGAASPALVLVLPFASWLRRRRVGAADRAPGDEGTSPPTGSVARTDLQVRVEAAVLSDAGRVREVNEDAVAVLVPGTPEERERRGHLAVVADGMGGHLAGEIASRLAVEQVLKCYSADEGDPAQALARALRRANAAIREAACVDAGLVGMGTTCTALAIRRGLAYCAHVGDSRVYLARDGQLLQMTEDQSAVMDLVRRGVLTRDEARHHPDRNVILRALGSRDDLEVSLWPRPFAVRSGDTFILCTDGLYDLVEEDEMLARAGGSSPALACRELVELARERGAPDNVSVAVLALDRCAGEADESGASAVRQTRISEGIAP